MGLIKPIIVYKDKVMETMLSSQTIVDLIDDPDYKSVPAFGLLYKKVFPYAYIPQTIDSASTLVCVEANIANVKTDTICDVELSIYVMAHTSVMRTDKGARIDVLSDAIDDVLNHSSYFGIGKITPNTRYPTEVSLPNYDYICRKLTYISKDFNYRGQGS